MINRTFKVEKKEAKIYPPLPEDVYQVELLDITSEERATYDTRNNAKEEQEMETILKFQFTLLEGSEKVEENGKKIDKSLRGRSVWENFVPIYLYEGKNGKNKLYKITEALIGRELTREDEMTMDSDFLESLIGSQLRILIEQKKKDDKVFDKIVNYLVANSKLEQLSAEEIEKARVKKDDDETIQPKTSEQIQEEKEINEAVSKL